MMILHMQMVHYASVLSCASRRVLLMVECEAHARSRAMRSSWRLWVFAMMERSAPMLMNLCDSDAPAFSARSSLWKSLFLSQFERIWCWWIVSDRTSSLQLSTILLRNPVLSSCELHTCLSNEWDHKPSLHLFKFFKTFPVSSRSGRSLQAP